MMPAPGPAAPLDERFPRRARQWKLRTRTLALGRRPLVMGILNVTPDSFSDGGRFLGAADAVEHARRLTTEGADLLDIGGESTRPYSHSVPAEVQMARVLPVIEALGPDWPVPISIDTTSAAVAQAALAAGVEAINDVSALRADPDMLAVARAWRAGLCVMHMQGTPQTMQDDPTYGDVVAEVRTFLAQRRDELVAAGIDPDSIALDPGIGFGKSHQHNLVLTAEAWRLHELGCPVLVGPSRKAFIGKVLADKALDRAAGTVGVALALALQGVQVVRVHDVAAVRQALLLFEAAGGIDGRPARLED